MEQIKNYIKSHIPLYRLSFGAICYSVDGLSVVIDDDCMSKNNTVSETVKYVILRPNAKIYTRWDDPASILF